MHDGRPPLLALVLLMATACRLGTQPEALVPREKPREPRIPPAAGEEIVVCGRRFFVGAPVVLWSEPPGYDATSPHARFGPDPTDGEAARGLRYQPGRKEKGDSGRVLVEPSSDDLDRLRETVDQFVLHYDAAGTSRRCFRILHDQRGLSVHFLLDVDGTIYQTLDLRDQAWHATKANPRSIGIEIANLGAYPPEQTTALDQAYTTDAAGPWLALPSVIGDSGVRSPGFVARPRRLERVRGVVQGLELEQVDFTPQQYDSLVRLAAALCVVFPRIAPDAPRDEQGRVRTSALSDAEFESFHGILGHCHVQANKQDPGPAFDWEGFLAAVRENLARSQARP